MAWTKIEKTEDSAGFLEYPGFLMAGFLEAVSKWLKITKASDTWVTISKVSDTWTKI